MGNEQDVPQDPYLLEQHFRRLRSAQNRIFFNIQQEKEEEGCHELEWIEKIDTDLVPFSQKKIFTDYFKCCICLNLLREPLMLKCGHLYCSHCMSKSCSYNKKRVCPQCNRPFKLFEIDPHSSLSASIQKLIYSLTIACHVCAKTKQTPWIHQFKLLPDHLEIHDANETSTCQQCHQKVLKLMVEDHEKIYCDLSKKNCSYCKNEILKKDIYRHMTQECIFSFTQCSQCNRRISKQLLEFHQKKCTSQFISKIKCNQSDFGCSFVGNEITSAFHQMKECKFQWKSCYKCLVILMKKDLDNHGCQQDEFDDSEESEDLQYEQNILFLQNRWQVQVIVETDEIIQLRKIIEELFGEFVTKLQLKQNNLTYFVPSEFVADNIKFALNAKYFQSRKIAVQTSKILKST